MKTPDPRDFAIRPIEPADDAAVAHIIRTVMPEFGAVGCGFAINDPEVAYMSRAYAGKETAYFVVTRNGEVIGGGGIAPLAGAPPGVCELRKMYFLPEARGHGLGQQMMDRCLEAARARGFHTCYLETLENMAAARRLYERNGFRAISEPMGDTGHFSCNSFYVREL